MQSLEEQRQVYRNLEAQQQRSEQEFQETLRREADRHEKQRAEDQAAWDRRLREEQELRTAEAEANLRRLEECQQDALRRVEEAHEQERTRIHQERLERWRRLRREYPVPAFLQQYVNEVSEDAMADANNEPFVNVALVGDAGRGKSSLIRAILQHFQIELPEDQMPVVSAEGDGTTEPTRYPLTNLGRNVSLWDLPGQGTRRIPSLTYLRDMGLKYLDLAVLVTCERVTEGDLGVLVAIKYAQDVRCLVARTKVDLAVDDEQHDHGLSQEEALNEVRRKVQLQTEIRPERIHLVTSRVSGTSLAQLPPSANSCARKSWHPCRGQQWKTLRHVHHNQIDYEARARAAQAMQEAAALKRAFEEQQRQQLLLAQEEDRRREEMRLEALQQEEKRRQKRAEEQAAFKRRLKEEEDKRRRDAAEAQRRLEAEQENARRLEREARLAERKREQEERVEQWKRFKREYPVPEHLKNFVNEVTDATPTVSLRRFVNVAFVGSSGKGKSSLIRVVLKYFGITLPAEQMPRVSAQGDGTTEATRYPLTNLSDRASLWDHPGQGTEQVHSLTYLRDIGLKYFDLAD
eukprot:symbB.v1.2.024546.t1/scaffold2330.1/size82151/8